MHIQQILTLPCATYVVIQYSFGWCLTLRQWWMKKG